MAFKRIEISSGPRLSGKLVRLRSKAPKGANGGGLFPQVGITVSAELAEAFGVPPKQKVYLEVLQGEQEDEGSFALMKSTDPTNNVTVNAKPDGGFTFTTSRIDMRKEDHEPTLAEWVIRDGMLVVTIPTTWRRKPPAPKGRR